MIRLAQRCQCSLTEEIRCPDIEGHDLIKLLGGGRFQRAGQGHTGVVDQNVQTAEPRQGFADGIGCEVIGGDISSAENGGVVETLRYPR